MSAVQKLIQAGIQTGLIKGIKKGIWNRNLDIIKNMLAKGFNISSITEITEFSREVVEKLIKE